MRPLSLILIVACLVLGADRARAQTETTDVGKGSAASASLARTGFYIELLGSGFGLSVHLDYLIHSRPGGHISVHAGAGGAVLLGFAVPVGASYLWGRRSRLLETGLSALMFGENGQTRALPMGWVGYRYQPRGKGLLFRIGVSFVLSTEGALLPGLSIGSAGG